MKGERLVGSLRCGEVLERLHDYVEGTLDGAEVTRVEEHLRGCDTCERFGGVYQSAVVALRDRLSGGSAVPRPVLDRLRARLDEEEGRRDKDGEPSGA